MEEGNNLPPSPPHNPPSKRPRDEEDTLSLVELEEEIDVIVRPPEWKLRHKKGDSVVPESGSWFEYAKANPEFFPEVHPTWDYNFDDPLRRVDLSCPNNRVNYFITPACIQYVRACHLAAKGKEVDWESIHMNDWNRPFLLKTTNFYMELLHSKIHDPNPRCEHCRKITPDPWVDHYWGFVNITRFPEEYEAHYRARIAIPLCDDCSEKAIAEYELKNLSRTSLRSGDPLASTENNA